LTVKKPRQHEIADFFRAVNHRIQELSALSVDGVFDFVCECSNESCTEGMTLTAQEYDDTHSRADSFAVRPGHEDPLFDEVVLRTPRYYLVISRGALPART
jgi:hypothetical protein